MASNIFFGATLFIASEVTGHIAFNAFGASFNLACLADPTCRALNEDEIKLAKPYFGTSIDYDKVRFYDRNWILKGIFNTSGKMSSQFGAIYNSSPYSDKHITQHGRQAVFLHEMMHVWQFQNLNLVNLSNAFLNTWEYTYYLDSHPDLYGYGIEQQGRMIQDLHNAFYIYELIEEQDEKDIFYNKNIQPLKKTVLSVIYNSAPS